MTKLWVTRTRPAADESAENWRAAGFETLVEPLLKIQLVAHKPLPKTDVVIFTSKNGVDHVLCGGQRAICVGDATAAHARQAGFSDVISVDGTSADVTAWVRANMDRKRTITHVSGWHVRGSIIEDLLADGYPARRVKVYRSIPRPVWPEIRADIVALYSPLAAQVFAELAKGGTLSGLSAICISQAAADELAGLSLKSVLIASRPREDELIMAANLA